MHLRPEGATGRLPGILACHGHGPFGKEPVSGNASAPELRAAIESHNYDYGRQMAQAGYAVIGMYDTCFLADSAMACHRHLETIYAAAGAADRLELDAFAGPHAWSGRKSVDFFRKYL